ncbi:MAG: hypothetical protein K6A43_03000 [Treponema sp.]|nr:hypothetical protein [Treponema sp.]
MKKFLMTIAMAICVAGASFAQSFNIDAGVAMDYSDGYDGITFGGTIDFDYVLPANVAIFSNTTFTFGSEPKSAISEILGVGYRFGSTEKMYFQVGAGLGLVFFDHGDDSNSDSYSYSEEKASLYCEAGPGLAVKFAINFTDYIGMNFGVDAIYNPVKLWSDADSIDPESHLSLIPKVCAVFYF